jgi:hypothetical protein
MRLTHKLASFHLKHSDLITTNKHPHINSRRVALFVSCLFVRWRLGFDVGVEGQNLGSLVSEYPCANFIWDFSSRTIVPEKFM